MNRPLWRIAWFFGVLLLAAVVYQEGYLRLRSERAALEELAAAKAAVLARSRALAAAKPGLEAVLERRRADRAQAGLRTYEAPTAALAAAALQASLREMVLSRRGGMAGERLERTEDQGPFRRVTVAVEATLPDVGVLADLLRAIEAHTPSLHIGELEVRIRNFQAPRELSVKLTVSALTGGL